MIDFNKITCFLLDLDGTVYLGKTLIEGAKDAIARMRSRGRVLFVTNNSSVTSADYVLKLNEMGIDCTSNDVYTSGDATVDYLNAHCENKSVYLLGTQKLQNDFSSRGIILSEDADLVVVGFDKTLNYNKLCTACNLLRCGAGFIATHPDLVCPTENGSIPDAGSFLALFKAATGRTPSIICGKPNVIMGEGVLKRTKIPAAQTVMLGDRLLTDMLFAKNNGFKAALVLSGEATQKDLSNSGINVDAVLNSIADLF